MSVNVDAKSADRGKRSLPSQKRSPNKGASGIKTETCKRGSNSSVSTIDKYLIKSPAAVGLKRTNNNVCESKFRNDVDSRLEEKACDLVTELKKEAMPEPEEVIDVDDSDLVCETKQNGSKEEKLSASDPEGKHKDNFKEERQRFSGPDNSEEQQQSKHSKPETQADDGDSTDNVQSENEAETQEYEVDSTEDARVYVDYKEEDFNTDSDFDKSDFEANHHQREDSQEEKGERRALAAGSKRQFNTAMGNFICMKKSRKEKCQGSSSEEETDRPWRTGGSLHRERVRSRASPYPTRSPRLNTLKRQWSDRDTQQYRAGYPDKKGNLHMNMNLEFYQGKIRSKPDGAYIDDFHKGWWHNHGRLESHHGYIQWLFPIRESGMNFHAQELQLHEAEAIRKDPKAMMRFKQSYKMMLYFYGIELVSYETGEVARADNWQSRFRHLNHSMHNYLRITRILKCLGEMGLEDFKTPFLEFMLDEATRTRKLDRTLDSCYNYWIGTVKDDRERERLKKLAEEKSQGMSSKY